LRKLVDEVTEFLHCSRHSVLMILSLIDDLLDLAKEENLTFELNKNFFNIFEVAKTCLKKLEYLSNKKEIETTVTVADPLTFNYLFNVFSDRGRFE
jgi:signal transduction histidine kinase